MPLTGLDTIHVELCAWTFSAIGKFKIKNNICCTPNLSLRDCTLLHASSQIIWTTVATDLH